MAYRAAFVPSSKRKKIHSTTITPFPPLQPHQSLELTHRINAYITENTKVMKREKERRV
jgi:hypothetical protein